MRSRSFEVIRTHSTFDIAEELNILSRDHEIVRWQVFQECNYPNDYYIVVEYNLKSGKDLPQKESQHE